MRCGNQADDPWRGPVCPWEQREGGARSSRAGLRLVKGEPRGKGPGRMVSIISINQFLSSLLRRE